MATLFSRTTRALEADDGRRPLWALAVAGALLAAWAAWFFAARVGVYEVSDDARVESGAAPRPVEAAQGGRVVTAYLELGRRVAAGEVLVELEDDAERLALDEARARHATIEAEIAALEKQQAAVAATVDAVRGGRAPERAELAARAAEAKAAAAFARTEAQRVAALHGKRQVSDEECQRAEAEAARLEAAAEAARRALQRGDWDRRRDEHEREAEAGSLAHDVAAARGRLAEAAATIARLEQARDDRRVRAPVAGVLDEVAPLTPGAVVKPADRLATIVPDGPLRVVARFTPVALGRLAAGQPAVVRLQGFPWTQYGVLRADVERVAGEIRDGRVRVELAAVDAAQFPAPLRHGLPGTVEVEVERVAPATLVLRLAGRLLDREDRPGGSAE